MPTSAPRTPEDRSALSRWISRAVGSLRGGGASQSLPPAVLDAVDTPLLIVDADDCVQTVNRAAADLLGHADLVGKCLADTLLPPAHRDAHRRRVQFALSAGADPDESETLPVATAGGAVLDVRVSVRAVAGGRRPVLAVGLHRVVAADPELEAARGRQRTLRTIVDAVPDPVVAVNRRGRVVLRNRAAARAHVPGLDDARDDYLPPPSGASSSP